jgi:hypothetical protein
MQLALPALPVIISPRVAHGISNNRALQPQMGRYNLHRTRLMAALATAGANPPIEAPPTCGDYSQFAGDDAMPAQGNCSVRDRPSARSKCRL